MTLGQRSGINELQIAWISRFPHLELPRCQFAPYPVARPDLRYVC
jgi:hypothetical protein